MRDFVYNRLSMKADFSIVDLPESGKLDFKESYGFMKSRPASVRPDVWGKYISGQWDEFIKDVLAVSNGDLSASVEPARLVIGVRETDGIKEIVGIDDLKIDKETMLKKINSACSPALPDLIIYNLKKGEKKICIIEIPYIGSLMEVTRNLNIYSLTMRDDNYVALDKNTYTRYSIFYRSGENVEIASLAVKDYLAYAKSGTAQAIIIRLRDEITRNLAAILYKNGKGYVISPIYAYNEVNSSIQFKLDGDQVVESKHISLLFTYALTAQEYCDIFDHRVIDSIFNNTMFRKFIETDYEYSDIFFEKLIEFKHRSGHLIRNRDRIVSNAGEMAKNAYIGAPRINVESRYLLMVGTYLARAYDITVLYISMLRFLDKDYDYMLRSKISTFYIAKGEVEKSDTTTVKSKEVNDFILRELERLEEH